jgi:Protein of unknown function (DUF3313)
MNTSNFMKPSVSRRSKLMASILAVGLLTACRTTHQISDNPEDFSGFLGDYSQLHESNGDEANYIYIDKSLNAAKYTKIYIKPIELWNSDQPDSKLGKVSPKDQELLVSLFYTAIIEAVGNEFQIVDHPGPDTLVAHVAITEARKCKPVANLITSVLPQAVVLSVAKQAITGTGIGVGLVRIEADFTDGETGQRLGAVVDARAGGKAWSSKFDGDWGDANLAFEYWSIRFVQRYELLKSGDFSPLKS